MSVRPRVVAVLFVGQCFGLTMIVIHCFVATTSGLQLLHASLYSLKLLFGVHLVSQY